eukprot:gene7972-9366_t
MSSHVNTIAHLVESRSGIQPRKYYHIPEDNQGYKMMLETGWTEEQGLGRENQGRLDPIATALKLDRKGLGNTPLPSRVTHRPQDIKSAKAAPRSSPQTLQQRLQSQRLQLKRRQYLRKQFD